MLKLRPSLRRKVNIIQTTDIHGWYQGHLKSTQPEPNYSGDWGDFASFVAHMRRRAKKQGVDLLVVDSGDLHDGAGLSDGFPMGQGPDAHVSNQFHSLVKYDALAVGNHELYIYENALDTYQNFVPQQHGRYAASNVNISYAPHPGQANVTKPMGERFIKFKTDHGRRVTAFGVLYNFQGQDKGLTVQPPKDMVNEAWFAEAIKEEPDFFLLNGHMPVRRDDWPVVVNAIRKVHPTTPLIVTGGHTHIRDCYIYDSRSFGIEAGRYLETIGWLSFNLTSANASSPLSFSRSYIDANRRNYAIHAGLSNQKQLDTAQGISITKGMDKVAADWNLTQVYGNNTQDYYLDRVPATDNSSILHLLTNDILPTVISTSNPDRKGVPNFVLANSGSQRFDAYKGPFTKNDQYIVSPFTDHFLYLQDVPYKYASTLLGALNGDGQAQASSKRSPDAATKHDGSLGQRRAVDAKVVDETYSEWRRAQNDAARRDLEALDRRADAQGATLGYVTKDSCPGLGDDTEHVAIPYASQPDYVASPLTGNTTAVGPDDKVDVIFLDFIVSNVVRLLNNQQKDKVYNVSDATPYNALSTQDLYPLYFESLSKTQ